VPGVIHAPFVRLQGQAIIATARQAARHRLATVDVEQTDDNLVRAAFAQAVQQQPPILRHVQQHDGSSEVGAHGVGVDQHLIGAVQSLAQRDDRKVLVGLPSGQKVASLPSHRQTHRVDTQERFQVPTQRLPARQAV